LGKALVSPFYGMVGAVVTEDTYDLAGIRIDPRQPRCVTLSAQVRTSGYSGKFWF